LRAAASGIASPSTNTARTGKSVGGRSACGASCMYAITNSSGLRVDALRPAIRFTKCARRPRTSVNTLTVEDITMPS
jgi:hypothetical protein